MSNSNPKFQEDYKLLAGWATKQLESILDFMTKGQIEQFLDSNIYKTSAELEVAFSELLDMTNDRSKKFMNDLKIKKNKIMALQEKKKKLEEDARKKNAKKKKQAAKDTQFKNKIGNREKCICQGLVHPLVSNCTGCGRIVCEEEGEGECLFCGQYVESVVLDEPVVDEKADPAYAAACERRDKLLGFDKAEVMHSAIKDQGSDWYELENNTWQSKEQRELAKEMRQFEEKAKKEAEDSTFVSIGGGKGGGLVSMKSGKVKAQEEISKEANDYINQLAMDQIQNNQAYEDEEIIKENFKNIKIKSCQFLDEKSKELMDKLRRDALQAEQDLINEARRKEVRAEKAEKGGITESLSERLQSENPFDEFKKFLDEALKKQEEDKQEEVETDKPVEA